MVSTNNLKNGMTLLLDGNLMQVVDFQHVKPGKGGAFVRTRLKNVETGRVLDRTFRAGEDVPQAIVQKRQLQYLYREGDMFVFMDATTYEQQRVPADAIGEAANWFTEGDTIDVLDHEGRLVGVELPAAVVLAVTDTEPGIAGNTVQSATKAATLETGVEVQVPLFVDVGDKIKVDTRSGGYLSRA
ncbi:MAG TPA: elongation factor P [Nitriliruptorales bacterium]|nr:elongation factor P [Nitriliruptorales bacterium]